MKHSPDPLRHGTALNIASRHGRLLIYRYRDGAAEYAANRAAELRAQGKHEEAAEWERTAAEIKQPSK